MDGNMLKHVRGEKVGKILRPAALALVAIVLLLIWRSSMPAQPLAAQTDPPPPPTSKR